MFIPVGINYDRVLEDRDEVKLGGVTLVARLTPGHTRGCTTYTLKVKQGGKELLTTQCYIKGFAQNEKDFVWNAIPDAKGRDAVSVDFAPMKGARAGELSAKFDIVLGVTPEG